MKKQKGLTLLEIIMIIASITVLLLIALFVVNPKNELESARNLQRRADVNSISNAIYQYRLDTGKIPESITSTETEICAQAPCGELIDLSILTKNQEYLIQIPKDPTESEKKGSGYTIIKNENDRVTVSAPGAEANETILVIH